MHDPLFTRSLLAIEESRALREERRLLMNQQEIAIYDLRWAVYESSSVRIESKARRDDKGKK